MVCWRWTAGSGGGIDGGHTGHTGLPKLFQRGGVGVAKVMKLPVPVALSAEESARAETERRQQLFNWAEAVFKELGLIKVLAAARSLEQLHGIVFNVDG